MNTKARAAHRVHKDTFGKPLHSKQRDNWCTFILMLGLLYTRSGKYGSAFKYLNKQYRKSGRVGIIISLM
jgi:hypothetical protein